MELDAEPLLTYTSPSGEQYADRHTLDAHLCRSACSTHTLVNLIHDGLAGIHLTPSEAVAMGEILTRLGRLAPED